MSTSILVVEDEPAIQELLRVNLEDAGFTVSAVADAESAQTHINHALPDLVLLDWMLPGLSGLAFARSLRGDARTRELPIIMVTARSDEGDRVAGLEAWVDDYITKPFSPRVLKVRIKSVLGTQPMGFRAPGYTVSDELLQVVRDCGMTYDSSVFPSPPYYAAKAAALVRMKVRRQLSSSVLDTPRVLRAPTTPYRVGVPYWMPGAGLLELPIQVAGPLRLPFIGTSLTLLGTSGARLLTRGLVGTAFVNLELHGIDFLEARDVPPRLLEVQPDLRVPLGRKLDTLAAVLETLRDRGYASVRLAEAARAFS